MRLFILTMLTTLSWAQQPIAPISLPDMDGKSTAFSDCTSCKGVAIIFTSNECPYDASYRNRIRQLAEFYAGKIFFLLVNAHTGEAESKGKMKTAYVQWGLTIPYLSDKDQVAMSALDAKKSPEVILLRQSDKTLTIVYHGAIDNNPQVEHDAGDSYLKDAIESLLGGTEIKLPESRVVGCTIKKK